MGDIIDVEDPLIFNDNELVPEHCLLHLSLNAIAAISTSQEELKKKLFDVGCHKIIIELLKHSEAKIRSSACLCLVSLGKAEKGIKVGLMNEGVDKVLYKLLYDPYLDVQVNAASALCNVTLDNQKQIIDNTECVKRLVELTQSKHTSLRYKAIFALKNLVFMQSTEIKKAVMSKLTFPRLFELFDDEEPCVQEQAICMMRNLLNKQKESFQEVNKN